ISYPPHVPDRTHTHTHTHTRAHTHMHSHTHKLSDTHTHPQSLSLTHTHTQTLAQWGSDMTGVPDGLNLTQVKTRSFQSQLPSIFYLFFSFSKQRCASPYLIFLT